MSDKYLEKLDALVESIMDDAKKDGVKLSERLEALKICSAHYVNTQRLKGLFGKPKDDSDTGGGSVTMDQLRGRVAAGAPPPPPAEQEPEDEDDDATDGS